MKWIKCCSSCSYGISNKFNKDILCKYNGIVSRDYKCSKYRAFLNQGSNLLSKNKCIDCEFFIVESSSDLEQTSIGYCQLFTVRQFDGGIKKACSKFCPKPEYYIS